MIKLIGIPFDANASFLRGPAAAPDRIRLMDAGGSANKSSERGLDIIPGRVYEDVGNMDFPSEDPKQGFEIIKSNITALLNDGAKILSLGGDHSVSYPILTSFTEVYSDLHILHIDAHSDLYHDFDGNPYSHASPFARVSELTKVSSLTQIGIRTLTSHQREQIERFGVHVIEMRNYHIDEIPTLHGPLYISLDLDVLDPAFAPGVSHHEPGGMSTRQLLDLLHLIDCPVVGADIVECNPDRDVEDMTAMVGYKMVKELIELMYRN